MVVVVVVVGMEVYLHHVYVVFGQLQQVPHYKVVVPPAVGLQVVVVAVVVWVVVLVVVGM